MHLVADTHERQAVGHIEAKTMISLISIYF